MKTLDGLNLHNNPISFPPGRVLEKGVKEIVSYLYVALQRKDKRIVSAGVYDVRNIERGGIYQV